MVGLLPPAGWEAARRAPQWPRGFSPAARAGACTAIPSATCLSKNIHTCVLLLQSLRVSHAALHRMHVVQESNDSYAPVAIWVSQPQFVSRPPSSTLWGSLLAGKAGLWGGKLREVPDHPAARAPPVASRLFPRGARRSLHRNTFGHLSQ